MQFCSMKTEATDCRDAGVGVLSPPVLPVPDSLQLQACLVDKKFVPRAAAIGCSGQTGREPGGEMAQDLTVWSCTALTQVCKANGVFLQQ